MSTPHTSSSPESIWAASDRYHNARLIRPDTALEAAVRASDSLSPIAVSAAQGKLLKLLALSIGAARVLEVGTLGGYSTIWMAQAIKDKEGARIVSCEVDDRHAHVARENLKNAGFVPPFAEIIVGPAHDTLKAMHVEMPFDMVFIDADKKNNTNYVIEAKRLLRTGGIIIVDNVGRAGIVAQTEVTDNENVNGVRALLEYLKEDSELDATTIHTVGEKGFDGFTYAIKL